VAWPQVPGRTQEIVSAACSVFTRGVKKMRLYEVQRVQQ